MLAKKYKVLPKEAFHWMVPEDSLRELSYCYGKYTDPLAFECQRCRLYDLCRESKDGSLLSVPREQNDLFNEIGDELTIHLG